MSWLDRLNNVEVKIKTGDGKIYTPLWKNAKRDKKYNTSAYNFINQEGTLIDRRQPEGFQYDLELYFTGENHLDTSSNFNISADNKGYWTITHPFYGDVIVQPLSISEDNTQYNSTRFNIKVWETISNDFPKVKKVVSDEVFEQQALSNEAASESFGDEVEVVSGSTATIMNESIDSANDIYSAVLTDTEVFTEFQDIVSETKRLVNAGINKGIDVMRSVHRVINYPIIQVQAVKARLNVATELFGSLKTILLDNPTKENVSNFEAQASAVITVLATSAITPGDEDYNLKSDVIEASDTVRTYYLDYLNTLDLYQGSRSDDTESFTPDDDTQRYLDACVNECLANLFLEAYDAKQERIINLDEDSNPIVLTHRFYGLDNEDSNLNFFIESNALSMNELYDIKKGRQIIYYI